MGTPLTTPTALPRVYEPLVQLSGGTLYAPENVLEGQSSVNICQVK